MVRGREVEMREREWGNGGRSRVRACIGRLSLGDQSSGSWEEGRTGGREEERVKDGGKGCRGNISEFTFRW